MTGSSMAPIGFPVVLNRPADTAVDDAVRLEQRLTPAQVADLLQVDVRTVYRHCRDGVLPCSRVGNRIRITPQDLDAYRVRQREASARGEAAAQARGPGRPAARKGRFARIAQGIDDGGETT